MLSKETSTVIEMGRGLNKEIDYLGRKVQVHVAPEGTLLDTSERFEIPRGGSQFEVVVEFGDLFERRGMSGSVVPGGERWVLDNMDWPEELQVLEAIPFLSEEVGQALDELEKVANTQVSRDRRIEFSTFLDPDLVCRYADLDRVVASRQRIAMEGMMPVAVLRAGMSALNHMGVDFSDQVLVHEKRLYDKDDETNLAVGIRLENEEWSDFGGKWVVMREVALATGSSLVGFDLACAAYGVEMAGSDWMVMVGSQQGLELVMEHKKWMEERVGKKTQVSVGRVAHVLTGPPHAYYIKNVVTDQYSMRDAGDMLDSYLPVEQRALWPGRITQKHVEELHRRGIRTIQGEHVDWVVRMDTLKKLKRLAQVVGEDPIRMFAMLTGEI